MAAPAASPYDTGSDDPHHGSHPLKHATEGKNKDSATDDLNTLENKAAHSSQTPGIDNEQRALAENNDRFTPQPAKPSLADRLKGGLGKAGNFFWGSKKRKAGTSGGLVTTIVTVMLLWIFGIGSGPLQFVHLAQILTHGHFDRLTVKNEKRLAKMIMGMRDLSPGETRLNWLTRRWNKNILADLKSKGIIPEFNETTDKFIGFTIDTTNPNSEYFGKSQDAAVNQAQADLGKRVTIDTGTRPNSTDVWDGKLRIRAKGTFDDITALRGMVRLGGASGVSSYINTRVLGTYGMVPGRFHLLKRARNAINETKDQLVKQFLDNLFKQESDGAQATEVGTNQADIKNEDNKGNVTDKSVDVPEGPIDSNTKSILSNIKLGKTAGIGIAALTIVVCAINTIRENYGVIRFVQVILPAIRMAMAYMSTGSQVQSNQDVNIDELAAMSQQFNEVDSKGNVVSNWSDAAPIQSETGNTGGIDMTQTLKDTFSDQIPGWLAWTENGLVSGPAGLCSQFVQTGMLIVSIAILLVPGVDIVGGVIELIAGALVGLAAGPIIDALTNWVAGQALNVHATGAQFGNIVDYGSALASNQEAVQYGGVALTDQQVSEANQEVQQEDALAFHSESLADRLFNPYDYRSVFGNMIDHAGITSPASIFGKIGTLPDIVGSLFKTPALVLSSNVHAASAPYQYPFQTYGFGEEDTTGSAVDDPYANAETVAKLLDNNNTNGHPDYIAKALQCFGISITKGDQGWDAIPSTQSPNPDVDRSNGVNVYDTNLDHYNSADCVHPAGFDQTEWLRIRYWILDTRVMEGYTCYLGDDQSCINSGMEQAAAPTSSTTGTGTGVDVTCSTKPSGNDYNSIRSALLQNFKIKLEGDQNANWAMQDYNTACALAKAPAFFTKLVGDGPITVRLHAGGCAAGHSSSTTGIDMYGMCSPDMNRYLWVHELGHMYAFRNGAVYQEFLHTIYPRYPSLPTFNCQFDYGVGPFPGECFADMIGEYVIYFNLRGTAGGRPPGPHDFKEYPTKYAGYYDFARDHIFGGVEYTSF